MTLVAHGRRDRNTAARPPGPSGAWRALGWLAALLCSLLGATAAWASEPGPSHAEIEFFEKQVRPLLVGRCLKCHGQEQQKGGLRLDRLAGLLDGGDSGPAMVRGKPEDSLLIEAVNYRSLEMPPDGKLGDAEIEILTRWVRAGAPWPDADKLPSPNASAGKISDEDRQWWAFQPLRDPAPPAMPDQGWAENEIDEFVFQKLIEAGLQPAPEAERQALARRVYFDLLGVPPSPAEARAFLDDSAPDAYRRLVERLLASPQYGQRWARYWLDLVRYADSDGYRADDYRPHAWRYRDYVVRSFNDDKPYDRFVQEQLAGDELFPGEPEALTGTGYLRNWIYEYNNRDARGQWKVILDDITDTTSDVFLGLGMQCARCHDHKFDPILQKDYYRLQAFFAALLPQDDVPAATQEQQAKYAAELAGWEAKTADLRREIAALEAPHRETAKEQAIKKFPADIQEMLRKPELERTPLERQVAALAFRQVTYEWDHLDRHIKKGEEKDQLLALQKRLAGFDDERPKPLPLVLAAGDLGAEAAPVLIPKKGQEPIAPGFLTLLDEGPAEIAPLAASPRTTGRRAALARWLTRPEHPLTSRVIVNRVWQHHFGRGLAANASDFGKLGGPPSHPELLDWLASRFVADGWSLKQLHRRILLSATYRQSASHPDLAAGRLKDPENRLYWRASARRLDAEQIRDALYAASGELRLDGGGPGAPSEVPRRSIFLRVMRNTRVPLLDAFDAPFWISSAASRDVTTTPIQALLLINAQFMLQRAAAFADRLHEEAQGDPRRMTELAYQLAFGRSPKSDEAISAEDFLRRQVARIDAERAGAPDAAFLHDKIPFRDGQAALFSAEAPGQLFQMSNAAALPAGDFTIEAYLVLRSVYETGGVRVLAANGTGDERSPGWSFGVTGKQSRRKPQTLVLQLVGKNAQGQLVHEPLFSDQHLQLNKPYYVGAAVRLAGENAGSVTFYLKDLANDDEPLLSASVSHSIAGEYRSGLPLTIGGRAAPSTSRFDGLIDDVRLSDEALPADRLLYASESPGRGVVGMWRFEPLPDVFADASGHGLAIAPASAAAPQIDPRRQAWIDFCHVLLNSNEFLYVE